MKIEDLRIGMEVRHPDHGIGVVKALDETTAKVHFNDATRDIAPGLSDLQPVAATAALAGLERPLSELIEEIVSASYAKLPLSDPMESVAGLGERWRGGKLIMQPADTALQSKELELEAFFHKFVMMRSNFRVLEQRVNSQKDMSSADKFDIQQYITRCYGSMTSFNVLFKDKEDHFSGKG